MKKFFISFAGIALIVILNSCRRDVAPLQPVTDTISFKQSFDSIQSALNQGWVIKNNSRPLGTTTWFQGVFAAFPGGFNSYTGADYIAANFNNAAIPAIGGESTISNWLITPARPMKNGDVITFYSRTFQSPALSNPDRLELRFNTNGSTEVGNDSSSVGDFTKLVLSINPDVNATDYPAVWTQFSYTLSGLAAPKTSARFAFRYYKTLRRNASGGGISGYIGIDEVVFTSVK